MSREKAKPTRQLARSPEPPSYPTLLQALNHPLRRQILLALHEAGEARSPRELSQVVRDPLSNVSYHVRVLRAKGVVALTDSRQVRGSSEHFYASVLPEGGIAVRLLESTAREERAA
jgi:DNA-binding transcriptional ArsR family regulator